MALTKRQEYLDQHLQNLVSKAGEASRQRWRPLLHGYTSIDVQSLMLVLSREHREDGGRRGEGVPAAGVAIDPDGGEERRHGALCRQRNPRSSSGMVSHGAEVCLPWNRLGGYLARRATLGFQS